jgi:hypothetical protein
VGTFLTTPKMSPALAARVEASVTGRPVAIRKKASPRVVALLRLAGLGLVLGLVAWVVLAHRQYTKELEAARRSLLQELHARAAVLTDKHKTMTVRGEALLAQLAGTYPGDLVAKELRDTASLTATLARPMVYVRGPLEGFASTTGRAELAEASFRDAFVLCLIDPPTARTEKSLAARARAALGSKARTAVAAHVERLHSALVGMRFFSAAWEERVQKASNDRELANLSSTLHLAPLDESIRALQAELLLVAMDEPKIGTGPTDLDGSCPHHVRVALIDLDTDTPLLRLRKFVDPGWISNEGRVQYASGINSCELALEVRAEATGIPAPTR